MAVCLYARAEMCQNLQSLCLSEQHSQGEVETRIVGHLLYGFPQDYLCFLIPLCRESREREKERGRRREREGEREKERGRRREGEGEREKERGRRREGEERGRRREGDCLIAAVAQILLYRLLHNVIRKLIHIVKNDARNSTLTEILIEQAQVDPGVAVVRLEVDGCAECCDCLARLPTANVLYVVKKLRGNKMIVVKMAKQIMELLMAVRVYILSTSNHSAINKVIVI